MTIRFKPILLLALLLSTLFMLGAWLLHQRSMPTMNAYTPHFGVVDRFYTIFTGHKFPKSAWFEKEQALYQSGFKGKQFDLLVVPAQVQNNAIDPIGRSLMSAYLVDAISQRTDIKVPDPYYVARALGANKRQYNPDDVYQLANDIGVSTVVWVYVGHKSNMQMNIKLFIQERDSNLRIDAKTKREEHNWDAIAFSDQQLPSEEFVNYIDDVLLHLPIETPKARSLINPGERTKDLPESPIALVRNTEYSALETAEYYQWLGVLMPKTAERQRQIFFEKSLVMLRGIVGDCNKCKILKARAYSYLHRRPAALAVLGHLNSAEAKSVLAKLNGNMNKLTEFVEQSASSLSRKIAIVALADMEAEYGKPLNNRSHLLGEDNQKWRFLLERRLNENDTWFSQSNTELLTLLKEEFGLQFTPKKYEVSSWLLLLGSFIPGDFIYDLYQRNEVRFELSIHQKLKGYLKTRLDELCCVNKNFSISELDYLLLLDSILVNNALRPLYLRINAQGLYQGGIEEAEVVQDMYSGLPAFEYISAVAYHWLYWADDLKENKKQGDPSLRKKYISAYWATVYLLQRQTKNVHTAASKLRINKSNIAFKLLEKDFPRRYYWWTDSLVQDRNYHQNNPYHDKYIKVGETSLEYTQTSFNILKRVLEKHQRVSEGAAGKARATQILADNKNRFVGRANRAQYFGDKALGEWRTDDAINLYKENIASNPEIWNSYHNLARVYIFDGEYSKALSLMLSYPLINDPKNLSVKLSNNLSTIGHQFYWRGKIDAAEQIYALAVKGSTGSAREMNANLRLALLSGDLETATIYAKQKIDRYDSHVGYREYMLFQHALGHHQQAEQYFRGLLKLVTDMQPWHGVFVGHQKRGFTSEQLKQWLQEESSKHDDKYYLAKYSVMALLTDRSFDSEAEKLVELIEGKTTIYVDTVENKFKRPEGSSHYQAGPSRYNNNHQIVLSEDAELFSDLVLFTRGYTQILQGDYAEAFQTFEQYAQTYFLLVNSTRHALPYLAWSAIKSQQTDNLEAFLDSFKVRVWQPEYYLAKAILIASKENVEKSIELIEKSVDTDIIFNYHAPLDPWYQLVEICEWLYEDIGDERYKALALKYAKQFQIIRPMYAWAYAVEAKLTDSPEDRIRALAFAQSLDPRSRRISGFSEQARSEARAWLLENETFLN